jgi:hypothetical protein
VEREQEESRESKGNRERESRDSAERNSIIR